MEKRCREAAGLLLLGCFNLSVFTYIIILNKVHGETSFEEEKPYVLYSTNYTNQIVILSNDFFCLNNNFCLTEENSFLTNTVTFNRKIFKQGFEIFPIASFCTSILLSGAKASSIDTDGLINKKIENANR